MGRRLTRLVAAAGLLGGCAVATDAGQAVKETFTNPTGIITFQRQEFIDTYATARQLYVEIRDRVAAACRAGQIPGPKCAELAEVERQAKELDFAIRAKIAVPETQLDWEVIEKILSFAVKMVL